MLNIPRAELSIWTSSFFFCISNLGLLTLRMAYIVLYVHHLNKTKKLQDFVNLMQRNSSFFHRSFEAESRRGES